MSAKVLGLFPGQGSQKVGMGKALFEGSDLARKLFKTADDVLGFPLSTYCFEGPEEKLTETAIAQPAILTVSTILFELAREADPSLTLSAAAGHSLGEYSALVAAGAISFPDAVALVHKRGTYMQSAVPVGKGKMIAVLGKEPQELEEACSKVKRGVAEIANINAPGQIVIAGDREAIDELISLHPGAKIIELQVSAPFHCSLMKPAEIQLSKELATLKISKPSCPVYANYSAKSSTDPEEIRNNLIQQVCSRVRWVECMNNAIAESNPTVAVEFGAGTVLTGLLKRIAPTIARKNVTDLVTAKNSITI